MRFDASCGYHVLRILAVAVCRIGDVCCLLAPAFQPFWLNSLGLSAAEKACSRNVCTSGTLKFRYEGIFKISPNFPPFFSIFNNTELATCNKMLMVEANT